MRGVGCVRVLALGALDRDLHEPLPGLFSDGAPRTHFARKGHMGNILLWGAVSILFVGALLAILAF